jgi:hypothetical protein
MRVWDVDPAILCRQHLLGEHRELHGLWNILTKHEGKGGYAAHPETRRWVGREAALFHRHAALVAEMKRRGYRHASDLDAALATGQAHQDVFIDAPHIQIELLCKKPCPCPLPLPVEARRIA